MKIVLLILSFLSLTAFAQTTPVFQQADGAKGSDIASGLGQQGTTSDICRATFQDEFGKYYEDENGKKVYLNGPKAVTD